MKNFKKIAFSFMLAFVMILSVACGSKGGDSATYVLDKNGISSTVVLHHKNDEVTKLEVDSAIPYSQMGIKPEQKDQLKQGITMAESGLKSIKGLDAKFELKDDVFVVKMTIDYSQVDFKQLEDLAKMSGGSLTPVSEFEKLKSFKEAENNLLKSGFVKK